MFSDKTSHQTLHFRHGDRKNTKRNKKTVDIQQNNEIKTQSKKKFKVKQISRNKRKKIKNIFFSENVQTRATHLCHRDQKNLAGKIKKPGYVPKNYENLSQSLKNKKLQYKKNIPKLTYILTRQYQTSSYLHNLIP